MAATPSRLETPKRDRAKMQACVHFWAVHPPQGAVSWGECRKCGKRRRFSNRFDGRDRANNSDLFIETGSAWRPNRRAGYYAPGVRDAYEEARPAGGLA